MSEFFKRVKNLSLSGLMYFLLFSIVIASAALLLFILQIYRETTTDFEKNARINYTQFAHLISTSIDRSYTLEEKEASALQPFASYLQKLDENLQSFSIITKDGIIIADLKEDCVFEKVNINEENYKRALSGEQIIRITGDKGSNFAEIIFPVKGTETGSIVKGLLSFRVNLPMLTHIKETFRKNMIFFVSAVLLFLFSLISLINITLTNIEKSSKKITDIANLVMTATRDQATSSQEQSAAVLQTSASMDELAKSSKSIALSAASVATTVEESGGAIQRGVDAVQKSVDRMNITKDKFRTTLEQFSQLKQQLNKIYEVVSFINTISYQTKLIAFNATLEAVGAGEAGKRFGVVAREVRRLAESVAEYAQEIQREINQIHETANQLVIAAEDTSRRIEEGLLSNKEAFSAFGIISDETEKITDATKHISLSTQQQQLASEQILLSIQEISTGVNLIAQGTNQTKTSVSELVTLAEGMKAIVKKGDRKKWTARSES